MPMSKVRKPMNLRALQLFEAVARHRSLTRAAQELGITQSAVSHQLRNLAARLGEELVERRGRGIGLTDAGAQLARTLGSAFDIIEEQVGVIESHRPIVRLGVYSSFAIPWLIARLPAFHAAHAGIDLRLVMLYDPHEVTRRIADVFVTSEPHLPGFSTRRLAVEQLVPVAAPGGTTAFDRDTRFISAEVEPGIAGRAWEAFFALNDTPLPHVRPGEWLCCSHYIIALEMVLAGLGVALLPDFMVAQRIADGLLVRLPGQALPTGQTYELQVPSERRSEPAIAAVTGWLERIAATDLNMIQIHD